MRGLDQLARDTLWVASDCFSTCPELGLSFLGTLLGLSFSGKLQKLEADAHFGAPFETHPFGANVFLLMFVILALCLAVKCFHPRKELQQMSEGYLSSRNGMTVLKGRVYGLGPCHMCPF